MIACVEADRAPARRIAVGEVVSETFSLYGRNAGPLLGSAIVVFVIVGPLSALVENSGGVLVALLAAIIRLAGVGLYAGVVVRLVQDARDGRRGPTLRGPP